MRELWDEHEGTPLTVENLPVSVRDYDIETIYCEYSYDRHEFQDPKRAEFIIHDLRQAMIHQIAEKLFDFLDFQDDEDFSTNSVRMKARVKLLRRKE